MHLADRFSNINNPVWPICFSSCQQNICVLSPLPKDLEGIEGHGLVETTVNGRQEVRLPWIPNMSSEVGKILGFSQRFKDLKELEVVNPICQAEN
jgi:hypothetical protein